MNDKETKTDIRIRLQAIANRLGVPFDSLFKEATKAELNAQREQWDALKKRVGGGSHEDITTILKSIPGRDRPAIRGDEWPPKKKAARHATPAKRGKKVTV